MFGAVAAGSTGHSDLTAADRHETLMLSMIFGDLMLTKVRKRVVE